MPQKTNEAWNAGLAALEGFRRAYNDASRKDRRLGRASFALLPESREALAVPCGAVPAIAVFGNDYLDDGGLFVRPSEDGWSVQIGCVEAVMFLVRDVPSRGFRQLGNALDCAAQIASDGKYPSVAALAGARQGE